MAREQRFRNFYSIVYPDSAPNDWQDILRNEFVPFLISPIHDKDVNPGGEPKKPHYHIILLFDSVKTVSQAREIFQKINAVGCDSVNSIRGYCRYLCHLDNPEKAQYNVAEVVSAFGVDYSAIIGLPNDKYVLIGEILDFINDNDIQSYFYLVNCFRTLNIEKFKVVADNSFFFSQFLKSKEHAKLNKLSR